MTYDDKGVRKAEIGLADGRELMYFGEVPGRPDEYPDRRQPVRVQVQSQARWDQLPGEWVIIATARTAPFSPPLASARSAPLRRKA
jgi:UDPglucose--hexose-1-phosphate uridylyltransferase